MKRTLIVILGIIVIALIVWAVGRGTDDVANNAIQGVVTSVDTEQAMFDGPYVVIIQTDAGTQETIHVPSMGLNLCEGRDSITNPTEISNGMRVEVAGTRAEGGVIVPCESTDHFLRII